MTTQENVSKPGLSVRPTRSFVKSQSFRPNTAAATRKPMTLPKKKQVVSELEQKLADFIAEKTK